MARETSPTLQTSTSLTTDATTFEPPPPPDPGIDEPAGPPRLSFAVGPSTGAKPTQPVTDWEQLNIKLNVQAGVEVSFTMPARSPAALATDGLATDLWVYRKGVLWKRCRVLPVQQGWSRDGSSTVRLTAVSYKRVVKARHIRSGPPTFHNVDEGLILWSLIQHTQAQVAGDLGITAGRILTGSARDRNEYKVGDILGSLMDDLGAVEDGVTFTISANLVFNALKWTEFATRADPIVHGTNALDLDRDRGLGFANVAGSIGSRAATTPVWIEADDLATDPRGLWEAFDASHSTTYLQPTVVEYAQGLLEDRTHPPSVWTIELDPDWYFDRGADYNEGEFVRVVVPLSAVDEIGPPSDALVQITEVTLSTTPDGTWTVRAAGIELSSIPVVPPPPPDTPPVNTVAPVLSVGGGLWKAGLVWSCSQGTWTGATTWLYAWEEAPDSSGPWTIAPVSDPGGSRTTPSYAPPVARAGKFYRCTVTAIGPGGSAVARSDVQQSVSPTPPPAPTNSVAPALSTTGSTFEVSEAWTCSQGTWSNATSWAYWWEVAPTAGGTYTMAPASLAGGSQSGSVYVPPSNQAGKFFRCRVTGTGPGGSLAVNSNNHVANVPPGTLLAAPPSGNMLFGGTFTVWNSQAQSAQGYTDWRGFANRYADIIHFYVSSITGWDGTISSTWLSQAMLRPGRKSRLAVNLKIASRNSRAAVGAGAEDAQLTLIANNLALYDDVVYLICDHEAENAGGLATAGNMPADFANAIRRVYQIVKPIAPNVDIGICPTGYSGDAGANGSRYLAMWPGDDHLDTCWWDPYFQSANRLDWVLGTGGSALRTLLNENVAGTAGWTGMLTFLRTAGTIGVNGLAYVKAGGTTGNPVKKGIGEWGAWKEVNAMNGAVDGAANGLTDAQAAARTRSIRDQYLTHTEDVFAAMQYHLNLNHFNHVDGNPNEIAGLEYAGAAPFFNYDLALLA